MKTATLTANLAAPHGRSLTLLSGAFALFNGLRIVAYEDGFLTDPERYVQRLAAVRETASSGVAPRYPL